MPELNWAGKLDQTGNRAPPFRVSLPFQAVETVNESSQQRQQTLDMFRSGSEADWRNRLIWGDKKYVTPALLDEFGGTVNLIYIDPPFATGADFSYVTQIPETGQEFTKEPSVIEQKAYRDTWGRGLDSYLEWFYEAIATLHPLLASDGLLWVHCDWRVNAMARMVLDEVFGADRTATTAQSSTLFLAVRSARSRRRFTPPPNSLSREAATRGGSTSSPGI